MSRREPDMFARSLLSAGSALDQLAAYLAVPVRVAAPLLKGLGTVSIDGCRYYLVDEIRDRLRAVQENETVPETVPAGRDHRSWSGSFRR